MSIELLLPIATAVAGTLGIFMGYKNAKQGFEEIKSDIKKLSSKIRESKDSGGDNIDEKEIEELISELRELEKQNQLKSKEAGFASKVFLVYIVPGVTALVLVALYCYMQVVNIDDPTYTIPENLSSLMTVIVGYLFGAGAASA